MLVPTYSIKQRKLWISTYPSVTPLLKPRQCEGWVSNASYTRGKYTCKNAGKWLFRYDRNNEWPHDSDAIFCWSHLSSRGVHGDMFESDKFEKWCKKNNYPARLTSNGTREIDE